MSLKRLAVVSAVHASQLTSHNNTSSTTTNNNNLAKDSGQHGYGMSSGRIGRFDTDLHGNVNVLLGGGMLGSVMVLVFLACYCCHRSARKNHRSNEYSQYWRPESDVHSLEVFTMDSHSMCYERNTVSLPIINNHQQQRHHQHHHHRLVDELGIVGVSTPRPTTPGPPPAYESVAFKPYLISPSDKKQNDHVTGCILPIPVESETTPRYQHYHHHYNYQRHHLKDQRQEQVDRRDDDDDEGLPSYEAALKLEAHGYV